MAGLIKEHSVDQQIMLLEHVLTDMARGRIRIPRFQRQFVWRPEQMLSLFDSVVRGYPVGSLALWETDRPIPSLDRVAGIDIPRAPEHLPVSYVLDGHQRLSTLFGALIERGHSRQDAPRQHDWKWDIYCVLGEYEGRAGSFTHWPHNDPPPVTFLPMRSVLRTIDFLAYLRGLTASLERQEAASALADEARDVAQRIKSYEIPVTRLRVEEPSLAVEIFSRLNNSGQALTSDELKAAAAHQEWTGRRQDREVR